MASRGVNKVILLGTLGADPELRYMPNGEAVANMSIATSETWKDKYTDEKKEKTEWHRVVIYRKLAEIAGEYLRKGSRIYVEGRLETRQYEQDGEKRFSTQIVVNEMQMLGDPKGSDKPRARPADSQPDQSESVDEMFDDDIPF